MRYLIAFRTRMLTAMKRFVSKRRLTGRLAQLCLFALPLAICSPLSASPTTMGPRYPNCQILPYFTVPACVRCSPGGKKSRSFSDIRDQDEM